MGNHVKFISYDGAYPVYCFGTLTLSIDGEEVTFGWQPFGQKNNCMFGGFWEDGVYLDTNKNSEKYYVNRLPQKYRKYADEIYKIFETEDALTNGCCGGCE